MAAPQINPEIADEVPWSETITPFGHRTHPAEAAFPKLPISRSLGGSLAG
jgi:hypothetical protein